MKKLAIWLACFCFGHRIYVVQSFSGTTRRIACSRCKKNWGMNDSVQLVIPWCKELSVMYFDIFGHKEIKPWR